MHVFYDTGTTVKKELRPAAPIIIKSDDTSTTTATEPTTRITIRQLSEAFARYEGYYNADSMAHHRKNPGNLRDLKKGGFRTFTTEEEGFAALDKLLLHYSKYSLSKTLHFYAPKSENDTAAYIRFVANKLNIDPNVPLKNYLQ